MSKYMAVVSIHPDNLNAQSYSEKWRFFLKKNGITGKIVNLYDPDALNQITHSDGVMWRWGLKFPEREIGPRIFDIIEQDLQIPVYPDKRMRYSWDDKIKQYYQYQAHGIDIPKTWIFWDRETALEWLASTTYPKVFKLSRGSSGKTVLLVQCKAEGKNLVNKMFSSGIITDRECPELTINPIASGGCWNKYLNDCTFFIKHLRDVSKNHGNQSMIEKHYAYFQEFIPDNHMDIRISVIGERAFAFQRLYRPNDFRASGSWNIQYGDQESMIPFVEKAFQISDRLNVQCMAYDFLMEDDILILVESCWTFNDKAVYDCPGHWNKDLEWVKGHMWPEEAQVQDFLTRLDQQK